MLKLVGLGGTFDHLHEGHELLVRTALSVSENIVIGLATDKMLKNKKFKQNIESYEKREIELKKYINSFTDVRRVKIFELNDPYGRPYGPIDDPKYEGQVISQETYPTALKINEIRESKGFKPLVLIVIPIIKDENNKKISSTSIREHI